MRIAPTKFGKSSTRRQVVGLLAVVSIAGCMTDGTSGDETDDDDIENRSDDEPGNGIDADTGNGIDDDTADESQPGSAERELLERYEEAYDRVRELHDPLQEAVTAYDQTDYEATHDLLREATSIEETVAGIYDTIEEDYLASRFEDEQLAEAALLELSFATSHLIFDAKHAAASLTGRTNDPYEEDEAHRFIETLRNAYEDGKFDILSPNRLREQG